MAPPQEPSVGPERKKGLIGTLFPCLAPDVNVQQSKSQSEASPGIPNGKSRLNSSSASEFASCTSQLTQRRSTQQPLSPFNMGAFEQLLASNPGQEELHALGVHLASSLEHVLVKLMKMHNIHVSLGDDPVIHEQNLRYITVRNAAYEAAGVLVHLNSWLHLKQTPLQILSDKRERLAQLEVQARMSDNPTFEIFNQQQRPGVDREQAPTARPEPLPIMTPVPTAPGSTVTSSLGLPSIAPHPSNASQASFDSAGASTADGHMKSGINH